MKGHLRKTRWAFLLYSLAREASVLGRKGDAGFVPLLLRLVLFAAGLRHGEALNGNGLWISELGCSGGRHD